jgi:hypothetical protein
LVVKPNSTCELAGALVCQSIPTLVGVVLAVVKFEIVRIPGLPTVLFPLTKPEQPLPRSAAPIAIRMMNGRLEIPSMLRKPLMIFLNLPRPTAFSVAAARQSLAGKQSSSRSFEPRLGRDAASTGLVANLGAGRVTARIAEKDYFSAGERDYTGLALGSKVKTGYPEL